MELFMENVLECPDHCLKRIRLIEDDILYNPRQIQVYLPWLEAKLINQLGSTVYTLYKQTTGNQFSCIVYTQYS